MPDSYYDPPEYDGCEDCECEDPERPEMVEPWVLRGDPPTDAEAAPCNCKCHNLPAEPDPYDLMIDRQMDGPDREDY